MKLRNRKKTPTPHQILLKRLARQQGRPTRKVNAHYAHWRESQEFEYARQHPASVKILVANGVAVEPFVPSTEYPDPEL